MAAGGDPARRNLWLTVFAAAMAYVESAVVVYLRLNFYPDGFDFPLVIIPQWVGAIEVGREAATLVMLAGMAALAGRNRWDRFLCFCLTFGIWDIFYYAWLRVFLGWPASLLTWDILFLIPVPWAGPVLAPVLISLGLLCGSLWLMRLQSSGITLAFAAWHWALAVAGGLVVLLSFTLDYRTLLQGGQPPPFRWWLFLTGAGMGTAALILGVRSLPRIRTGSR